MQWRRIYPLAESIAMSLPGPRRRLAAWLARMIQSPDGERPLLRDTLGQDVAQWRHDHFFDLVIVTHSALRPSAWHIDAPLLQCDTTTPSSTAHALRTLAQISVPPTSSAPIVAGTLRKAA